MKTKFLIISLLIISKTVAQTTVFNRADSLMQAGDYQRAIQLLEGEQPTYKLLKKIAENYQQASNYSKAISYYQKAYGLYPSDKLKAAIGNCYEALGNIEEAMKLYEEVLQMHPENLLLKYQLAKLYISNFKVEKGIKLLKELSQKDSLNPNYPYQLGNTYAKLGTQGFIKSGNYYLQAYRIDSTHVKSIYNLAKFFEQLRFKDSTMLFINKGLMINPNSINFNQLKSKHSYLNKELDTALAYLKKLENLNFKTKFTYQLYGLVYLKKEDFKQAENYLKKAQRIDFRDPDTGFNLGLAQEGLKKYKEAERAYMFSILNQKPDTDKNYLRLGLVQLLQNKQKEALLSFEKGFENNSQNYNLLYQLAITSDTYYKDKEIALGHYKKYMRKFEDKDQKQTAFVQQRIKAINKGLFMDKGKAN